MAVSPELRAFIQSPDAVDFVTRASDAFFDYVRTSGEVVVAQVLSGRYVLCYVKRENFPKLMDAMGPGFISSAAVVLGLLDRPALEAAGVIQVQNQPYLNLKGRGVLLGFVDTGIDYTQPVFRYEDGSSKIRYLFDQTAEEGEPPQGFVYGREYTVGAAPDGEIIAVKLRNAKPFYREKYCVPPEQSEAYSSSDVMVGVEYILKKARELDRPVVICLGLGTNFGSHDGFSVFEEYLGGASIQRGVCLCAAAGNEAQENHHAKGRIAEAGETRDLDIRVGEQAGDVWLSVWNTVADRLSLSVRSPTGELVGRVPARPGVTTEVKLILENTRIQIEYLFPVEGSGSQLTVVRILGATPGIWTVTLHGDIILDGSYHAWLPMAGFVSPTVEFLTASPSYTVTVPSTAVGVICCGAYNSANGSIWPASSWGPARSGVQLPDLTAPGVAVGGYWPYGYGTLTGTSAAAAVLAGVCALMLQWGVVEGNDPSMSTYQIRAYLIRGALRTPALSYPNEQWGYGTVQLMQSFHLMREL